MTIRQNSTPRWFADSTLKAITVYPEIMLSIMEITHDLAHDGIFDSFGYKLDQKLDNDIALQLKFLKDQGLVSRIISDLHAIRSVIYGLSTLKYLDGSNLIEKFCEINRVNPCVDIIFPDQIDNAPAVIFASGQNSGKLFSFVIPRGGDEAGQSISMRVYNAEKNCDLPDLQQHLIELALSGESGEIFDDEIREIFELKF